MDLIDNRYTKSGKWAVLAVVGMGVKKIVEDIVETNVTPENFRQKITVKLATYGLAAAAAFAVKQRLDKEINAGLKFTQNILEMIDSVMEGDVDTTDEFETAPPADLSEKTEATVALAA